MKSLHYRGIARLVDVKIPVGDMIFTLDLDEGFFGLLSEKSTEKHNHSSYEVHYITGGDGILHVENSDVTLHPDNIYIIPPRIYHAVSSSETNPLTKFQMRFSFQKKREFELHNENEIDCVFVQKALNEMDKLVILERPSEMNVLLENIHTEIIEQKSCYMLKVNSYFAILMIQIFRNLVSKNIRTTGSTDKITYQKRSEIIEAYFDQYSRDLTLTELAELINLSKSQLTRVLKNLYNTTFKQKLIDTRIEAAKDLLRNTSLTVESIAFKVGFKSLRNFQSMFKQKTTKSPSQYRAQFSKK